MTKRTDWKDLYINILIILVIVTVIIILDQNKLKTVKKDFTSFTFIGFFLVIVGISIWGLTNKNNRIKTSTRHAVVAFLIAYFAHVDMMFAAFFLVGIFVYYTIGKEPDFPILYTDY